MVLEKVGRHLRRQDATGPLPVVFVGHGSPMNAVEDNSWTLAWTEVGRELPRPRAVLCISAHWFTDGTYVHVGERPRTIYDFYGFPPELYRLDYRCPGSPELAEESRRLIRTADAEPDRGWGLDHGAWVPLRRFLPSADVPVFQLSIDGTKPAAFHYSLARELAPLRRRGVLILASGNIVHNLGQIEPERDAAPRDWAVEFDRLTAELIADGDHQRLIGYRDLGDAALASVPTPDHYFPLLSALALQEKGEEIRYFADGFAHASVSMRSFVIG